MKKISFVIICLSFFLSQCQKNTEFKSDGDFSYKAGAAVWGNGTLGVLELEVMSTQLPAS